MLAEINIRQISIGQRQFEVDAWGELEISMSIQHSTGKDLVLVVLIIPIGYPYLFIIL